MRLSHAQDTLNQTVFVEGSDIQEHIELLSDPSSFINIVILPPLGR